MSCFFDIIRVGRSPVSTIEVGVINDSEALVGSFVVRLSSGTAFAGQTRYFKIQVVTADASAIVEERSARWTIDHCRSCSQILLFPLQIQHAHSLWENELV